MSREVACRYWVRELTVQTQVPEWAGLRLVMARL
jgi:hypothetical protein